MGCFTGSCRTCDECKEGEEQFCSGGGMHGTYGRPSTKDVDPTGYSMGGYSKDIVVDKYVGRVLPLLPLYYYTTLLYSLTPRLSGTT